jgi:P27 family predicted phage terminase small subunit
VRGRKPTPTHLKLIRGNPGKRRIVADQFRPVAAVPTCPRHLKGEARKEWRRITALLDGCSLIAEVDRGALSMLCTAWARYVNAEEMIEKANEQAPGSYGLFVKSPNGMAIQSPWLAVSNRAMDMYRTWCAEFGITPAQRTRITPQTAQPSLPGIDDAPAGGFAAL